MEIALNFSTTWALSGRLSAAVQDVVKRQPFPFQTSLGLGWEGFQTRCLIKRVHLLLVVVKASLLQQLLPSHCRRDNKRKALASPRPWHVPVRKICKMPLLWLNISKRLERRTSRSSYNMHRRLDIKLKDYLQGFHNKVG